MTKYDDSITIEWHIDDVHGDSKYTLTDDQCREVLRRVKYHHDCNVGINWDVLRYHTDDVAIEVDAPFVKDPTEDGN
jgi:hypothetical protein